MKNQLKVIALFSLTLLLNACATLKPQYQNNYVESVFPDKEIEHSFYLIGDAGNYELGASSEVLKAFKTELKKATKNSTAIFLGDNVYPIGIPGKNHKYREVAEKRIEAQTDLVKEFLGQTVFIPGNHDWYSGIKGLKRQEEFVEKALGKNTFLPENGCPIEKIHVTEDIDVILVDSQWYLTNWNNKPTINDDCDIKTRDAFLNEFSSLIKKARSKTTIVAIHHPMFSNGPHGGQFGFVSHMTPLPVVGSLINVYRKTNGLLDVDLQSKHYNELKQRLVTLAQANKKVVFVSGHEHNLQYLEKDNLKQIVSGSGSKITRTRNVGAGLFSYGSPGFARLDVFKDGSSYVRFYSVTDDEIVYESQVFQPDVNKHETYNDSYPDSVMASVYSEEETNASKTQKYFWGDRYRKYFSTKVNASTVNLDTLFGGLKPVRKGGGNQSKSLRLEDKNGAQYVMRALRKQAVQYLQATIFKDQYIEGQFEDTAVEELLMDVFTGSHPYAPFVIGDLSDAIGVYHTNPVLYFVPKQKALGDFNDDFGGELYMIEEHTSEGHSNLASFGFQDTIESTDDMIKTIHEDEDIVIDEAAYIRARLFDMLIGDWDRHQDQWRWIEFKEDGKKIYRPLPRDRDQAFSIMGDGALLRTAIKLIPTARLLREYSDDLKDVKGVNVEPYPLDMELIQHATKEVWDAQVKIIQDGITDEVIDNAFLNMPEEVRDETVDEIKRKLRARRGNLQKISDRYFKLTNELAVVKGTNKDDWFDVERMPNGQTKITGYRIKDGEKADVFINRTYNKSETKEIWIYALDDDDVFHVYGNGDNYIKVLLLGGQNNDTYDIENGSKLKYYDYKSKPNTFKNNKVTRKLTDNYHTNVFNYKKLKTGTTQILPSLGANPDDGFKIGTAITQTNYNFERNPFTSRHSLKAAYYFATSGFDFGYNGEFANVFFQNVNLAIDVQFNSPNYATNFFGYGNETANPEAEEDDGLDVDLDYNRVKIRTLKVMPSLVWRGYSGSEVKVGLSYESNEVQRTKNRFIETFPKGNDLFDKQDFWGVDAKYSIENKDNEAFPTLGFQFSLQAGYKNNVSTEKGFSYVIPELGFDYKLIPSGNLVLATNFKGHLNLGNEFQFYQAANLGASNGLRGYRNQRFTGRNAFVQSTDLRLNLSQVKTGWFPLYVGVYGGFDYGRVWLKDDNSEKWNNSMGGGVFLNVANMLTGNISAFNSNDGLRLAFKIGFGF
ncbi:metallophosphoesterase [Psychroserpens ponticola]|uniref:Metallophosphoesterase n=1 Tax=Psychroserpens ponticola TaxID=2932268 RepID=A0ABY7RYD4_9FLAO|nr:metallophosphoesterase [Psychroserpens ponticola]WCO01246.1 metallophosphoesterase [Psychroserpens ponticola]